MCSIAAEVSCGYLHETFGGAEENFSIQAQIENLSFLVPKSHISIFRFYSSPSQRTSGLGKFDCGSGGENEMLQDPKGCDVSACCCSGVRFFDQGCVCGR